MFLQDFRNNCRIIKIAQEDTGSFHQSPPSPYIFKVFALSDSLRLFFNIPILYITKVWKGGDLGEKTDGF